MRIRNVVGPESKNEWIYLPKERIGKKVKTMTILITLLLVMALVAIAQQEVTAISMTDLDNLKQDPELQKLMKAAVSGNSTALSESSSKIGKAAETSAINQTSQEANKLKQEISAAKFVPGNGVVKDLINKLQVFAGEVSVFGGGTWKVLHTTEDFLINIIKTAGPSAFDANEQTYIAGWVDRVMQDRKEHPDFSSQVLPGFNQSP